MIHAHVGGVDLCARAFLTAAKLIEDGKYDAILAERYAGWKTSDAQAMLTGKVTLEEIAAKAETDAVNPQPRSGKQEQIENLLSRSIYSASL
jgi:xylose isomerase